MCTHFCILCSVYEALANRTTPLFYFHIPPPPSTFTPTSTPPPNPATLPLMIPPNSCRYCAVLQREHAQRWKPPIGWHTWTPPTDAQRKERMLANRAQRLAVRTFSICQECRQSYVPEPQNTTGFCSWACFDQEERPGAPEALLAFLGPGVTMMRVDDESS